MWDIETTDDFDRWFDDLTPREQRCVLYGLGVLRQVGPTLARPLADSVRGSRFSNMKELRVQAAGQPIRILYAFDPRRIAMVLTGGNKTGDARFYDRMMQRADELFAQHLVSLEVRDA